MMPAMARQRADLRHGKAHRRVGQRQPLDADVAQERRLRREALLAAGEFNQMVGGVFVVFENIRPLSEKALPIALKRWEAYQIRCGKPPAEARQHIARFDTEYFPLTIPEHLRLLNETGFPAVEILWASCLQAGFYALK